MIEECLSLLCDPNTHARLQLEQGFLVNPESGVRYRIRDGIPVFVEEASGPNRKYQTMYDRLAPGYDFAERAYRWLLRKADFRTEYIGELEIPPGGRVLEVSVGTGANLRYLRPDMEFFGLDLSWGMLSKCVRNLKEWNRGAQLFQGEAEHLPFCDGIFDSVFHVGGINFFSNKTQAIEEMIRVAKPGTKIVIADETEKVVSGLYRKIPWTRKYYKGEDKAAYSPIALVPGQMGEVQSRQIAEGKLYCLTFRKP